MAVTRRSPAAPRAAGNRMLWVAALAFVFVLYLTMRSERVEEKHSYKMADGPSPKLRQLPAQGLAVQGQSDEEKLLQELQQRGQHLKQQEQQLQQLQQQLQDLRQRQQLQLQQQAPQMPQQQVQQPPQQLQPASAPVESSDVAALPDLTELPAQYRVVPAAPANSSLCKAPDAAGPTSYFCPCCCKVSKFGQYGNRQTPDRRCPHCDSKERHRLACSIAKGSTLLPQLRDSHAKYLPKVPKLRVLQFGPEALMPRLFRGLNTAYESGDLFLTKGAVNPKHVTYTLDLMDVKFPDGKRSGYYDMVVVYHVLEHIPSDAQGLREIYRLLRPGGQAMLAVPLDQRLPATKEGGPPPSDRGAQARRYRKREYGQEDHLRIYSIDFADRVRAQGFLVQKIPIQQWMAAVDPNYAKFSNRENKEPTWFAGQEECFIATKPE